jgi:hypothetical protein
MVRVITTKQVCARQLVRAIGEEGEITFGPSPLPTQILRDNAFIVRAGLLAEQSFNPNAKSVGIPPEAGASFICFINE